MDYLYIVLIVTIIGVLFFTKSGKDFRVIIKKDIKTAIKEKKKHIRNSLIIIVVITIIIIIIVGVENIGIIILMSLGLGLSYIIFYILGILGLNPIVNLIRSIGSDNDYVIKIAQNNNIRNAKDNKKDKIKKPSRERA